MEKHVHDGHRERMKKRFLENGLDTFNSHEVLELLLFFGVPRKDTNPLAHQLIDRFGGLADVLNTNYERLVQEEGVTENVATLLVLMRQLFRRYQKEAVGTCTRFQGPEEMAEYAKTLFIGERVEHLRMLCLNNRGDLLHCAVISEGMPDSVPINTRAIVETALRFPVSKVVLAHNHPAGSAAPSDHDIQNTIMIRRALDTIGVTLVDHLVISEDGWCSMRNNNRYSAAFSSYILDDSAPDWLR